ncbi:hypothetical protein HanXRQr2_Chr15g0691341 [Helianthus annuus]|uniref:Uncharacterized protein n=1 Tax=Helianthus annuus TaxID=4232 RepID=A0A9K3E1S7_HELAN|nr:hypothetical protein HanXRQr2_Chr15g0691341 [Helianthus annuus]KAJ0831112.1 hypothetical protein HanPSC8_Chr15g0663241 [Helianthus annuus]
MTLIGRVTRYASPILQPPRRVRVLIDRVHVLTGHVHVLTGCMICL